jgi:hypothetical protein
MHDASHGEHACRTRALTRACFKLFQAFTRSKPMHALTDKRVQQGQKEQITYFSIPCFVPTAALPAINPVHALY